MPELPEVESVVRGLQVVLPQGSRLQSYLFRSPRLRNELPTTRMRDLIGQRLEKIERRAKYILFHFERDVLLSHLGMTGSWRNQIEVTSLGRHDHIVMRFEAGEPLIYNDPRRFGIFDIVPIKSLNSSSWLRHLGPEPLSGDLSVESLKSRARGKKTTVKAFLMDQKVVVGVGNIYASEALFRARVRPTRQVSRVSIQEWGAIVEAIQSVLTEAIRAGGTTLQDYRQVSGEAGGFQNRLFVYDRSGEACGRCSTSRKKNLIRTKKIVGRSTFWCSICQK